MGLDMYLHARVHTTGLFGEKAMEENARKIQDMFPELAGMLRSSILVECSVA